VAQSLQDLIEARRQERSFERLQEDSRGVPSRSRWHQLQKQRHLEDIPNRRTLEGIAEALNVSPFAVLRSCAVSMGWETGPQAAQILDRLAAYDLTRLRADQVEAVISVVASMLKSDAPGDGDNP
jgi:hypothetical protein